MWIGNKSDTSNSSYFTRNNQKTRIKTVGLFLSLSGIVLLFFGLLFIISAQLNYYSNPTSIMIIVGLMGFGLICLVSGHVFFTRPQKRNLYTAAFGIIFTLLALILFFFTYEQQWYYPTVSYIVFLYIVGFIVLAGNNIWVLTIDHIYSRHSPHPQQHDEHIQSSRPSFFQTPTTQCCQHIDERLSLLRAAEKVADTINTQQYQSSPCSEENRSNPQTYSSSDTTSSPHYQQIIKRFESKESNEINRILDDHYQKNKKEW